MKNPVVSILLLACLAVALRVGAPSAQTMGESECRDTCEAQRLVCIERCGAHPDPMECEARCDDAAEDCTARCRD